MSIRTSPRTESALRRLRELKPYDGWAVDRYVSSDGRPLVRLLRRTVPLTERGFDELHYDSNGTGCVVGLTSSSTTTEAGVVLVERDGTVSRSARTVPVRLPSRADEANAERDRIRAERELTRRQMEAARASRGRRSSGTSGGNAEAVATLTDEQNKRILQMGLVAILAAVVAKMLLRAFFGAFVVLVPFLYLYAVSTCPSEESFDAKRELKRVLRGHHLPDDHPEKPQGMLEKAFSKVCASVTTELATGLGYEVALYSLAGACFVAAVRVPAVNADCYWVGIFGKWRFVAKRDMPDESKVD